MKNKIKENSHIVITALIIGLALIFVQVNKGNSIEEQKRMDLAQEQLEQKQAGCLAMLGGLKAQWSNVIGVGYSEVWSECTVTYKDVETTNILTSPLSWMQDADKE